MAEYFRLVSPMVAVVHQYEGSDWKSESGRLWLIPEHDLANGPRVRACEGILLGIGTELEAREPTLKVGSVVFWRYGEADLLWDSTYAVHGSALIAHQPRTEEVP